MPLLQISWAGEMPAADEKQQKKILIFFCTVLSSLCINVQDITKVIILLNVNIAKNSLEKLLLFHGFLWKTSF